MKRIIACAAAILLAVAPAMGQECQPLAEIAEQLDAMGVTQKEIVTFPDAKLAEAYLEKASISVPADSLPVGLIVGLVPPYTAIGIVEPGMCVRYTTVISYDMHLTVMELILDSI